MEDAFQLNTANLEYLRGNTDLANAQELAFGGVQHNPPLKSPCLSGLTDLRATRKGERLS